MQCGTSAKSKIAAHQGIQSLTDSKQMRNASTEMLRHKSSLNDSMQIETLLACNQRSAFVQTDKVVYMFG